MTAAKVTYPGGMKPCSSCESMKSVEDFYLERSGYYKSRCKSCVRSANGDHYHRRKGEVEAGALEEIPKRFRDGYTKSKRAKLYGLDLPQLEQMEADQRWRCAICNKKRRLCVDHCHATGEVRGLLCIPCNSSIGQLGDNAAGLLRAIEYLRKFEGGGANGATEGGVPAA